MDTKIKLKVQGLTNSQMQAGAYALILAENGPRRIPVIVGTSEAQSIAIALEKLTPPRPLTHDLFVNFSHAFHIDLTEVLIHRFEDGIFYSKLIFTNGIDEVEVDSRTSDAIALALRMKSDIYTLESIMKKCGIVLDETNTTVKEDITERLALDPEDSNDQETLKDWLDVLTLSEISSLMEKAILEENYELADMYKKEMKKRKHQEENQ